MAGTSVSVSAVSQALRLAPELALQLAPEWVRAWATLMARVMAQRSKAQAPRLEQAWDLVQAPEVRAHRVLEMARERRSVQAPPYLLRQPSLSRQAPPWVRLSVMPSVQLAVTLSVPAELALVWCSRARR